MGMITRCSIIIYDDFGNVLIAERGKRNERKWGTFGKIGRASCRERV